MENIKKIVITNEGEKLEKVKEAEYNKIAKDIQIPGFRKGKAPKDKVIKSYGETNLLMNVADVLVQDSYLEMLNQAKDIEIVARPSVDIKTLENDKIEFEFTLTLRPEIKLGDYKSIKVEKEKVKVTKKEIDEYIENIRKQYSEITSKEGKVEDGDTAIIDFEGFDNGIPFEGGKGENYSLKIGSHTFIEGFEEQLIGMGIGEEKEINVTFPEDYPAENLKGKPVVFKVAVNDIKTEVLPEFNDEFFEDLGYEDVKTKEDLEKMVKEQLTSNKEKEVEEKYTNEILKSAVELAEMEVPEVMYDEQVDFMIERYKENLEMQGITLDMFFKYTNSDLKKFKETVRPEAINIVKERLVIEEIIKLEKIEVSDEEVKAKVEELAKSDDITEEEVIKNIGGEDVIKSEMSFNKAINLLKGNK